MRKFLLILSISLFAVNAYAVDFETLYCYDGNIDENFYKAENTGECISFIHNESGNIGAKICTYKGSSINDVYKKVMKAETYGAKYPENIPTSDYNKNGLVVKYMGKNKVKVTYNQVEGYAGFDFIINHDAKTKENAVTICNQQG